MNSSYPSYRTDEEPAQILVEPLGHSLPTGSAWRHAEVDAIPVLLAACYDQAKNIQGLGDIPVATFWGKDMLN